MRVPAARRRAARPPRSTALGAARARTCTATRSRGAGTTTAVAALARGERRDAGAGARPLRPLGRDVGAWAAYDPKRAATSSPRRHAADASARDAAISYAAYRLLLWRASFDANLGRTFALLTSELRSLCYSPDFTSTAGNSPAALGNRIAAAAIAAGRHDGSLEALHYADPSYAAERAARRRARPARPSTTRRSGSRSRSAQGRAAGSRRCRRRCRPSSAPSGGTSAASGSAVREGPSVDPGRPPLGDPSAPRTSRPRSA